MYVCVFCLLVYVIFFFFVKYVFFLVYIGKLPNLNSQLYYCSALIHTSMSVCIFVFIALFRFFWKLRYGKVYLYIFFCTRFSFFLLKNFFSTLAWLELGIHVCLLICMYLSFICRYLFGWVCVCIKLYCVKVW